MNAASNEANSIGDHAENLPHRQVAAWRFLAPIIAIAAAFTHAVLTSWLKWGDLVVDGGREMELPKRIAEGAALYADVRSVYGPLPVYLNAALFKVFGLHLNVLIAAGLLSAAALSFVLYHLARRFLDSFASTVVVVVFIYLCAFAHLTPNSSFNFVIPYAYAAIYGMVLASASLLFLVRHARDARDLDLALSLGFAVLASLCKLESTVAVGCAHAVHLVGAVSLRRMNIRRAAAYGVAMASVAAVYGALRARIGPALWSDNIFSPASTAIAGFARMTMGLDDILASVVQMAVSAALLLVAMALARAAARFIRNNSESWRTRALVLGGIATVVGAAYALLPPMLPLRMMSPVAIGIVVALAVRWWRVAEGRTELLAHVVLWGFIAGCLSRQMLRVVAEHYGFVLVPVPLVGLATALLRYLPEWTGADTASARATRAAALGMMAGMAVMAVRVSSIEYERHRFRIDSPRGSLIVADRVQASIAEALSRFPPSTRAIVVPQGAGLVFLSGLTWSDGTFAYTPTDLTGTYDDSHLVARWSRSPPDVVVYMRQDMSGFGFREFGDDFGQRSFKWLMENFDFKVHPEGFAVGIPRDRGHAGAADVPSQRRPRR